MYIGFKCVCNQTQNTIQKRASAYIVPRSGRLIRKHLKSFKDIPDNIAGESFRDVVDAVFAFLVPSFEQEIYDYYIGIGYQLQEMYTKEECNEIDNMLYVAVTSYISNRI